MPIESSMLVIKGAPADHDIQMIDLSVPRWFGFGLVIFHRLEGRVFANGSVDSGSILSRVILKKMIFDTYFLNSQHYKVRIKGKVKQSRERSCALPYASVY